MAVRIEKGEQGFVQPHGLWNAAGIAAVADGFYGLGKPGFRNGSPQAYFFHEISDGDTWDSGIRGIQSLIVQQDQGQTATMNAYFASAEDARNGLISFRKGSALSGAADCALYIYTGQRGR